MGKRIDELPVDDRELEPEDPRDSDWGRFLTEIDDLLSTGEYNWAEDTLKGIQETVDRTHRVSEAQRMAVGNIEAGKAKGPRRRYQGFSRRYR